MSAKAACRAWRAAALGCSALWRAASFDVKDTFACGQLSGPAAESVCWMRSHGTLRARVAHHSCACPPAGGGARAAGRHLSLPADLPLLSLDLCLKFDVCYADCAHERLKACACTEAGFEYDPACGCSAAQHVVGVVRLPAALRQLSMNLNHGHLRPDLAPLSALTALRLALEPGPAKARLALPAGLRLLELSLMHCDRDDELPAPSKEAGLPPGLAGATRLESLWVEWGSYAGYVGEVPWQPLPTDLSLLDAGQHAWCRQLTYLGLSKLEVTALPRALPPELRALDLVELCEPELQQAFGASMTALEPLRRLRRLTLPHGGPVSLPPAVARISSLEVLDLTGGAYQTESLAELHSTGGNWDGLLTPPAALAKLPRLRHLSIHIDGLNGAADVFGRMPRLETLRLAAEPDFWGGDFSHGEYFSAGAHFAAGYEPDEEEEARYTGRAALLALLRRSPRLGAIYSDDDRLRHLWGLAPLDGSNVDHRVAHNLNDDPIRAAARASGVPLLPEAEWDAAVGGGREWTPWDAVARGEVGEEWSAAGGTMERICCARVPVHPHHVDL